MANNIYNHYLETEILSADPVKLVSLLYRGAIDATAAARRHLGAGAIQERSRQINRAWEIVQELTSVLDHSKGGDLSKELAELYHYIQKRLLDANAQQADAPLAEVETLLTTLDEAWRGIQSRVPAQQYPPPPSDYVPIAWSA